MLKKIMIILVGVVGLSTIALASSDTGAASGDNDGLVAILLIVLLLVFVAISILYIMSQQKLATSLTKANGVPNINGAWFWTQLIPLWGFVALIVSQVKINDQNVVFIKANNIETTGYSLTLFWWYIGLCIVSFLPVIGFLVGLVSIIVFIVFWVKISRASKVIEKIMLNDQASK